MHGVKTAVNPNDYGTKAAAHYVSTVAPGETMIVRLRLSPAAPASAEILNGTFDTQIAQQRAEADEFYRTVVPDGITPDRQNVMRQALAGVLWSKQFYHYDLNRWLKGDPAGPDAAARTAQRSQS